ncbi:MAG: hypothetical protein J0M12_16305 [Deltaproteobacteria bacterium]|nr:hypothetical protein [Deltaproteobacteria bacterium]
MKKILLLASSILLLASGGFADERYFTYSYESSVLSQGEFELEQWVTNQNGKQDGSYSQWNYRTELEYGVTDRYTTALYVNVNSTHSVGVTDVDNNTSVEFKGFSWENIYQLSNPHLDAIGSALYLEYSTDSDDHELEGKVLLSKVLENGLNIVFNSVYEMEWEYEDEEEGDKYEKEATIEFTGGASYKLSPAWAVGLESVYVAAYPDGFDLQGREYQAVYVGPNVHYGAPSWWATLTFMPQVWGDGDGASGGRQLVHQEKMEIRLIVGYVF